MDIVAILLNARSGDKAVRESAEQQLQLFKSQNFPGFLQTLTFELSNEQRDPYSRRLAGVILKNSLLAKTLEMSEQLARNWLSIDSNIRNHIKQLLLTTLESPVREGSYAAAQVIAKIALLELPRKEWLNLIELLCNNITASPNESLIISCLETLGFVCEEIDPDFIKQFSNLILTAVVQAMRSNRASATNQDSQLNMKIIKAATSALINALEFVRENFNNEVERNYIMQIVCETTQLPNEEVRIVAFEALVKIANLYYEFLPLYIQQIFNITLMAITKDNEKVALQAVEFWSTICDEELEILEDIKDGAGDTRQCHFFIKGALPFLVPQLTQCLTKQDENADEDTWNLAMAAGTCLSLISNVTTDDVVPHIIPFVRSYITNAEWRLREAAVMALGSILEGPQSIEMQDFVKQSLPVLLHHLKEDQNELVKDTSAWTIGRICQFHPASINTNLPALLETLVISLATAEPSVAANVCWALHNVADAYEKDVNNPTSAISPFFPQLLEKILLVTVREDASEFGLRAAAYDAINSLITSAAKDCLPYTHQLVEVILKKLDDTFAMQIVSQDDREDQNEQQGALCGVLQVLIQKLDKEVAPYSDRMMTAFLKVLSLKGTNVQEDVLMAIGSLANAVEAKFEPYVRYVHDHLCLALSNPEENSVCTIAVGTIGDISRAIGKALTPFCNDLISLLLKGIKLGTLSSLTPTIISCIGDIALAIEGNFEPYLPVVLQLLLQASQTVVDPNDYDQVDYLNGLRYSVLETYTGIVQGLNSDKKTDLIVPHAEQITLFIEHIWNDHNIPRNEEVTRASVGVIGDLAHSADGKLKPLLIRPTIRAVISECANHGNPSIRELAQWAAVKL